jgi:hypothetical protein
MMDFRGQATGNRVQGAGCSLFPIPYSLLLEGTP